MNQHHDAFHPGILFGGKGIVLWAIAAIMMVEPAEAAQVRRVGQAARRCNDRHCGGNRKRKATLNIKKSHMALEDLQR
ncbi:hypothetical protein A249_35095 [Pseudomonas syringae pv. actinidiae ICMP 18804]|nr:hypothetical protein A249_35095 [Pseudomonas syringae pv. actinidiae ICMP 18804]